MVVGGRVGVTTEVQGEAWRAGAYVSAGREGSRVRTAAAARRSVDDICLELGEEGKG